MTNKQKQSQKKGTIFLSDKLYMQPKRIENKFKPIDSESEVGKTEY